MTATLRAPLPARALVALLAISVIPGCAHDADTSAALYDRCDIRELACQERVFDAIQIERGMSSSGLPPIRVIDRATFRAELEADAREVEPRPHLDAAYRLLALVPEESTSLEAAIDEQVERTAAFYRRDERDVTIVDRGAAMDLADDMETLAHELVHSLQDELHGITAFYEGAASWDESFARSAVVEGDATYHELQYRLRIDGIDPRNVLWTDFYDRWLTSTLGAIRASDAPVHAARTLSYVVGSNLLTRRRQDRGDAQVEELWSYPPESARELLFDRESGRGARPSPLEVRCRTSPAPPVATMEIQSETSMGGVGVLALISNSDRSDDELWRLARSVAADRLSIYGDAAGAATALVWRIRLDTEDDAGALLAAFTTTPAWGPTFVERARDEVVIVGATDPALAESWSARTSCE